MKNFIAAIDFGSQKIRVLVENKEQIVFKKDYIIPVAFQKIIVIDNKYQLIKQSFKQKIASDETIGTNSNETSYDFLFSEFKQILSDIAISINSRRIGVVLIVPELYSEVQRHTIMEILIKVGFLSVNFLNHSRVSAACIKPKENIKTTEIISIGALYTSFSLFTHLNGLLKTESKAGLGGFTLDKIIFERLLVDAGIIEINNNKELYDEIRKLIGGIEKLKINVLTKNESKHFAFSVFSDFFKDVIVDYHYIKRCSELFLKELISLENELIIGFYDLKVDQVLLTGGASKIDSIKQYFESRNVKIYHLDDISILKKALDLGRTEVLDILIDTKEKPEEEKTSEQKKVDPKDIFNNDWSKLVGNRYSDLQNYMTNKEYDKTENTFKKIDQLNRIIKLHTYFKAASHFYEIDNFSSAYDYSKKAININQNKQIIELFESIVFKEVEKLHENNNQLGVKNLLQDAKKLGVSANIKNAFDKENKKLKDRNMYRNSKFTKRKKR